MAPAHHALATSAMTSNSAVGRPAPLFDAPPRARRAIVGLFGLLALASVVGTALSPYLLVRQPWLLILLAPEGRHLALAAAQLPAPPLIALGCVRRVVGLLASFGIGALYGDAAVRWAEQRYPRLARLIGFLERAFARLGAPLLVAAPLHALAVLAGAAGSRFGTFVPAVTAGQVIWVTVYVFFGDAISGWTAPLIELLSENLVESTLVCVALVVLYQLASRLGSGRKEDA
jgi:membrane protein DedA with SNARE-associated domain